MSIDSQIKLLAQKIKLVIFDVDGVLTDGGLYFSDKGIEFKRFNSLDGFGIKTLKDFGVEVAVITARDSKTVTHRMQNLGIKHFYQGQSDKVKAFNTIMKKLSLDPSQIAYMGDDVIDLKVMKKAGLMVAPNNAHFLVKERAHIITTKTGGNGAVREFCDLLLQAQNKYDKAMNKYL